MKLNKIALALVAVAAAPLAANAGVTISPLLLGYHVTDDISDTADKQRDILRTGKNLQENTDRDGNSNGGVAKESSLYTGAALGIELTPSTQFQVEYGVSNANGEASEDSAKSGANRFDVEQTMLSGNFLIGTEEFTGYTDSAFKPYVLVGAGQSKIKVENQETYVSDVTGETVTAGTEVSSSKDTIGNLGLGAMYRINDALSLRGEARAIHNFDNNWWEGMALAGLEVVLGGHLAPTVAVPPMQEPMVDTTPVVVVESDLDSDGDGVPDSIDACPGTPMNVVVDERGCPVPVDITDELKMELRVFFDNDKSAIKTQYQPEIAKVAEKMREYPNSVARVEGHASKTGPSARYNQRLSEARAVAVKSMLTNEFGIAPNRLSTVGYGYDNPIAPNDTEEGRAMNRRVYAIITGDKTMTVEQTKDMVVQ
ncbi:MULTISPECIES: OmpA family protein [Psychrobacter]|uniref:OOP family OmpA-OmpF porin n=1 Tax=Psychrobacter fozii TaxID=198480 RepID=A0A2V4UW33_9GAMM|nr:MULTISPECIES: OmpA family protein [Psychrobacter]MBH0064069.1 OmpA family protein [Psychrobacter sp. SZ93C1]MBH0085090.1 OmpA family protein [Psychrobacter sp. SCQQ22]PYE40746.1 OOP family OmpA-OmpF porin [Psychrobacter fozii]